MLKCPGVCLTAAFCSYLEDPAVNSIMPVVIFSADPLLMRRVRTDLAEILDSLRARRHREKGSEQGELLRRAVDTRGG